MRTILLIWALLVMVSGNTLGDTHESTVGKGTLVVMASGFEHNQGQAGVSLFLKAG